jgi:SAM-dependent methyltransferase
LPESAFTRKRLNDILVLFMLSIERQNALREQYRQENPGWRPATEVYAGVVRDRLRPNSRVLDLGCGRGGLVEQLGHPLLQVVGLDPDLRSLIEHRLANEKPSFPRAAAWSSRLPFADSSFDLIFASWVLEHLAHPQEDLGQIARVLRPDGCFVFITPNKRHPLTGLNRLLGRLSSFQDRFVQRAYGRAPGDTFPAYYRANTASKLQHLAQASNMQLIELAFISDPTYLAFRPVLFSLSRRLESRLAEEKGIHLVGCMRRETTNPR